MFFWPGFASDTNHLLPADPFTCRQQVPILRDCRELRQPNYHMEAPSSHVYFSQRLRLHYVAWGNPDAPPLLLIHGGRDHCRCWDWVAEDLRGDYRVLAPDLRGPGDSQLAAGGSS